VNSNQERRGNKIPPSLFILKEELSSGSEESSRKGEEREERKQNKREQKKT